MFGVIRDMVFFRFCGIRRIIGAPLARDLRTTQTDPTTGVTEREAERLARCLAPLGNIKVHDRTLWDLRLLPEETDAADEIVFQLEGRTSSPSISVARYHAIIGVTRGGLNYCV